jgi:hypothetical protein
MALFDDRLALEITRLIWQKYQELGIALGAPDVVVRSDQVAEPGTLQHDLALLIGVANGEYQRTDAMVRQAEQALTVLLDLLLGNALHSQVTLPDGFWKTDIGVLVSRVRWWISVDDLITISNAAALAFGENTQANRMRIGRAIDSGLLEWVPDPSVANPQQNKRVLRPQVERLRDQRRLPESQ